MKQVTKQPAFKLRFKPNAIPALAERYMERNRAMPEADRDDALLAIAKVARKRGSLTRTKFLKFYRWKTRRTMALAESNRDSLIEEASAVAFGAKAEELRIGALMTLRGVSWPVASAILHWVFDEQYPLLDFRALWSLNITKVPAYDFAFWHAYVTACRTIAKENSITLRTLDRALWQHSFEQQPSGGGSG